MPEPRRLSVFTEHHNNRLADTLHGSTPAPGTRGAKVKTDVAEAERLKHARIAAFDKLMGQCHHLMGQCSAAEASGFVPVEPTTPDLDDDDDAKFRRRSLKEQQQMSSQRLFSSGSGPAWHGRKALGPPASKRLEARLAILRSDEAARKALQAKVAQHHADMLHERMVASGGMPTDFIAQNVQNAAHWRPRSPGGSSDGRDSRPGSASRPSFRPAGGSMPTWEATLEKRRAEAARIEAARRRVHAVAAPAGRPASASLRPGSAPLSVARGPGRRLRPASARPQGPMSARAKVHFSDGRGGGVDDGTFLTDVPAAETEANSPRPGELVGELVVSELA